MSGYQQTNDHRMGQDGRYPRSIEMLEKMADIFHVPLTYLQPDQSLFIERAAETYGKRAK